MKKLINFLEGVCGVAFFSVAGFQFYLYFASNLDVKHIIASGVCVLAGGAFAK